MKELDPIYWPAGVQTVPKGWGKPLKIGVPRKGGFNQLVKVSYDQGKNGSYVTGFSIHMFEAVVKHMPYRLPYDHLVPFYGTFDQIDVDNAFLESSE